MIKVYTQERPTIEMEGINIPTMVTGDLEAVESNGKVTIRRSKHNDKIVAEELVYTLFTDKSGAALGNDAASTVSALNAIFTTDATSYSNGDSAYDIAVAEGFVGTEAAWLASLNGSDGEDGDSQTDAEVNALIAAYILANPPTAATKDYASFYLGTGGLSGIGATASTVVINQTSVNTDPTKFALALNQVTVATTGNYKIDFGCYFNNSSTGRTEYTFWLELNDTEVPGSRSGNYQRGYDSGQSSDISMIVSVGALDTLRVRVQRTDGSATTGYQDDNGTRLTIQEL